MKQTKLLLVGFSSVQGKDYDELVKNRWLEDNENKVVFLETKPAVKDFRLVILVQINANQYESIEKTLRESNTRLLCSRCGNRAVEFGLASKNNVCFYCLNN